MKYVIFEHGGKQYKVVPGDVVLVDGVEGDKDVRFDTVLCVGGDTFEVGAPYIKGATVKGTVLGDVLGPKITVRKFKAKSNYHRTQGHRSQYVQVRIDSI